MGRGTSGFTLHLIDHDYEPLINYTFSPTDVDAFTIYVHVHTYVFTVIDSVKHEEAIAI